MSKKKDNKYIAILLACFNRKEKTLSCLKGLHEALLPEGFHYEVTLLDDGSTDGTSAAVHENFPEVSIINGNGDLYWNQGMRVAWNEAIHKRKYDYYLLLNDDTDLFPDAIKKLVEAEEQLKKNLGKSAIVIGSIADPTDGHLTYGGVKRESAYLGIKFSLVEPGQESIRCDTFNANCVLISKEIVDNVGILSDHFTHGMGDTDYGLRAAEKGFGCFIAPGYVGKCENNQTVNTWLDSNLTLKQRKESLYSPLGTPPDEWLYFVRRHAGNVWILSWLQLYLRLYFPQLWKTLRKLRGRKDD